MHPSGRGRRPSCVDLTPAAGDLSRPGLACAPDCWFLALEGFRSGAWELVPQVRGSLNITVYPFSSSGGDSPGFGRGVGEQVHAKLV
eukprot:2797759-Prymnesium_polylepis.1